MSFQGSVKLVFDFSQMTDTQKSFRSRVNVGPQNKVPFQQIEARAKWQASHRKEAESFWQVLNWDTATVHLHVKSEIL